MKPIVEEYVTIDDNLPVAEERGADWEDTRLFRFKEGQSYSCSKKDKAKRPKVLVTVKPTNGCIAQSQRYPLWTGFTVVPGYRLCGYVKESSIRALRATL